MQSKCKISARTFSCIPPCLFTLQLENATKKRERATSDLRTTEQKQEKKRLKSSKKPKDPDPPGKDFTPYDYNQSDFRAFAGKDRDHTKEMYDHLRCREYSFPQSELRPGHRMSHGTERSCLLSLKQISVAIVRGLAGGPPL